MDAQGRTEYIGGEIYLCSFVNIKRGGELQWEWTTCGGRSGALTPACTQLRQLDKPLTGHISILQYILQRKREGGRRDRRSKKQR